MISPHRWRENWRAIAPVGAVLAPVARSRAQRRASLAALRKLPPGTAVVVSASAPAASARCRRFATAAGLELERAYLAFPTAAAPAYLVEDAPAPVRVFVANVLAAPTGSRFLLPMELALGVLRTLKSWRLVRTLAPGRVVVGRRV